jgi:acyl-coenzyme A thioesterase PaaI-like protein
LKVRTLTQQNKEAEAEILRLTKSVRIVEVEVDHDNETLKEEISLER